MKKKKIEKKKDGKELEREIRALREDVRALWAKLDNVLTHNCCCHYETSVSTTSGYNCVRCGAWVTKGSHHYCSVSFPY